MSKPRTSLTDTAVRHQILLERLKEQHAVEFAAVFDLIEREVRTILLELEVGTLDELSKRKLNAVLSDLKQANLEYMAKAQASFFDDLDKLAGYEVGFEGRSFGFLPASAELTIPTAAKAFEEALARPLSVNGKLLESFIKGWSEAEVTRVNDVVRKAWGEGWTVDKLTTAIRGTKRLGYSDGILGAPGTSAAVARRNARTVARTSIQHVASASRMALWEANSDIISGYRFVATLDSRTTQQCRSLDGKVFKLGQGPIPPLHHNCRSTTVAVLDPKYDFFNEGATRSSDKGYVDADLTYYEWLKQQPAAFQDAAIGKTRGKLFRDGGLSAEQFADLNLGRNFQPLTLEQMAKLEPLAFEKAGIPTE